MSYSCYSRSDTSGVMPPVRAPRFSFRLDDFEAGCELEVLVSYLFVTFSKILSMRAKSAGFTK